MIKEYINTGQKYLCVKTAKNEEDAINYKGSGLHVNRILKKHGSDSIKHHSILLETSNEKELKEKAKYYSDLWNVEDSNEWLNLVPELGGGGCGKNWNKGRKIINDGIHKKYIDPSELESYLNNGWNLGRCQYEIDKLSKKLKGKTPWNKGRRDPQAKCRNPIRKSSEEKFKNRSEASKEIMGRSEVIEKLKAPRKPPITLIHESGEIKTLHRKEWRDFIGDKVKYLWSENSDKEQFKGWKRYHATN